MGHRPPRDTLLWALLKEKASLESRQVTTLGQLGTAQIRVQMGGSCSCHHPLKARSRKHAFDLVLWEALEREKKRFKFVTLSGLAVGRIEGLCVSPEKQCSQAAYFTQYPRRTDIYKGKDLFSFFKNRKKEEILLFCKGSPPPVLFTFIGSSKVQVQPHLSPPGTHKEQRWILQSATCCPVLWRTRALLLSSKNK